MKKRIFLKWMLVIFIGLLIGLIIFKLIEKKKAPTIAEVTVTAAKVEKKDATLTTQAMGTVEAYIVISVRSLVDGQILAVKFNEGDFVKRGQILFLIDPRPFLAALKQAESNLARDQANLVNAQKIVARNAPLARKGYVAQKDFEDLVATAKSLTGTVHADQAAITTAKLQLEYCTIRAPIAGKTGAVLVQEGNLVKTTDTTALVTINQLSPIYINFPLPSQLLPDVQMQLKKTSVPAKAVIRANLPAEMGTVTFVDNTINTTTGTIQLKATFANQNYRLWPGQFVNIYIPTRRFNQALIIPTQAILMGQKGTYVYVLNPNNTVTIRTIVTGPEINGTTIVEQGLQANDIVITSGLLHLTNGKKVVVNNNYQGNNR